MAEIRRIPFDELPQKLQTELKAKYERLGYLGEFFQVGAHQPEALYHFNRFTETLKESLPANIVELLALTLSTWSGNAYERVQHERLSVKYDLPRDWIVAVERLDPEKAVALSPAEKAVQRLALDMAQTQGRGAAGALDSCAAFFAPPELVAIMLTVGRYLAHSALANTLGFKPPVPSPLEDGA